MTISYVVPLSNRLAVPGGRAQRFVASLTGPQKSVLTGPGPLAYPSVCALQPVGGASR